MPSDSFTLYISATGATTPPNGSVDTAQLADDAVTTAKIENGAVTTAKIAAGSVDSSKLSSTSGSESVTTATIRDYAITTEKLDNTGGQEAVATSNIRDEAVTSDKIIAGAVTGDKIAAGAVLSTHIESATSTATGIELTKLRHVAAFQILGNDANTSGAVASISCSEVAFDFLAASNRAAQWSSLGLPSSGLVGLTDAQTLTNKTLTSPVINGGSLSGVSFKKLAFDTTDPTAVSAIGEVAWNPSDKTLDLKLSANVTQQIGQELLMRVQAATTVLNGDVVYISGATLDGTPTVLKASRTDDSAHKTLGVATEDISNGSKGFICLIGLVHDLDLDGLSVGDELWLDAAGGLTIDSAVYPDHAVRVGIVIASGTNGVLYVNPKLMAPTVIRGTFTWPTGGVSSHTVSDVTGLTSASSVVVQEVGATPVRSFYSVVCSTDTFTVHAAIDASSSGGGALPSGTVFNYIAFL